MTEAEQKLLAEIERLRRHIDAAFSHACAGDAHAARVELTEARWGACSKGQVSAASLLTALHGDSVTENGPWRFHPFTEPDADESV